jgi:hypothetical protein
MFRYSSVPWRLAPLAFAFSYDRASDHRINAISEPPLYRNFCEVSISSWLLLLSPSFLRLQTLNFSRPYLLIQESIFGLPHIIGKLVQRTFQWRGSDVGFESFCCLENDCKLLFSFTLWTTEITPTMMILYMKPATTIGILLSHAFATHILASLVDISANIHAQY